MVFCKNKNESEGAWFFVLKNGKVETHGVL